MLPALRMLRMPGLGCRWGRSSTTPRLLRCGYPGVSWLGWAASIVCLWCAVGSCRWGDRWASYEKWDLGRRAAKVEGSGSPKSNSESGVAGVDSKQNSGQLFFKGVENQVLAPWRVAALQAAYSYHGIPVTVGRGSEEQMLANTLHVFLEEYLKENSITPERGVYEFSRLPLGVNMTGVTITGKKYRQYVAIAPVWKGSLTAFRDINAGDALFQRARPKVGIAGFTIPGGKKVGFSWRKSNRRQSLDRFRNLRKRCACKAHALQYQSHK